MLLIARTVSPQPCAAAIALDSLTRECLASWQLAIASTSHAYCVELTCQQVETSISIDAVMCSGQKAALAGGTTFHIDFAQPLDGSLTDGLRNCQEKAKIAIMDYGFHMTITKWTDKVPACMLSLLQDDHSSDQSCFLWTPLAHAWLPGSAGHVHSSW